jgi:hypothetical protein
LKHKNCLAVKPVRAQASRPHVLLCLQPCLLIPCCSRGTSVQKKVPSQTVVVSVAPNTTPRPWLRSNIRLLPLQLRQHCARRTKFASVVNFKIVVRPHQVCGQCGAGKRSRCPTHRSSRSLRSLGLAACGVQPLNSNVRSQKRTSRHGRASSLWGRNTLRSVGCFLWRRGAARRNNHVGFLSCSARTSLACRGYQGIYGHFMGGGVNLVLGSMRSHAVQPNPALNLAPFGRWTALKRRRLALRWVSR